MVQIGNFHIGTADTAVKTPLTVGEAYVLWDNLIGRYQLQELLQLAQNYAHDSEFVYLIKRDINGVLADQINVLEKQFTHYHLPLPKRPPKNIEFEANSGALRDQYIFRRLFTGVQEFLALCSLSVRLTTVNDELREIFIKLLMEKIAVFDDLCKYGKIKGWFEVPPFLPTGIIGE